MPEDYETKIKFLTEAETAGAKEAKKATEEVAEEVDKLAEFEKEAAERSQRLREKLDDLAKAGGEAGTAHEDLSKKIKSGTASQKELEGASGRLKNRLVEVGKAQGGVTSAFSSFVGLIGAGGALGIGIRATELAIGKLVDVIEDYTTRSEREMAKTKAVLESAAAASEEFGRKQRDSLVKYYDEIGDARQRAFEALDIESKLAAENIRFQRQDAQLESRERIQGIQRGVGSDAEKDAEITKIRQELARTEAELDKRLLDLRGGSANARLEAERKSVAEIDRRIKEQERRVEVAGQADAILAAAPASRFFRDTRETDRAKLLDQEGFQTLRSQKEEREQLEDLNKKRAELAAEVVKATTAQREATRSINKEKENIDRKTVLETSALSDSKIDRERGFDSAARAEAEAEQARLEAEDRRRGVEGAQGIKGAASQLGGVVTEAKRDPAISSRLLDQARVLQEQLRTPGNENEELTKLGAVLDQLIGALGQSGSGSSVLRERINRLEATVQNLMDREKSATGRTLTN